MEQTARIRWNSLFSLLTSAIQLVANAILFLSIARFYGPEAFGQFTTAHLLSTLFLPLADFGLDLLFTTEVARQRANADLLFRRFAVIKLSFSGIAVIGMWLLPFAHDFSEATRWLIYIFSFSVAFTALANFFFALFKGLEQFQHQVWISFAQNVVLLISLVLLGILHAQIWLFAVIFTVTRALGVVSAAVVAARLVRFQAFRIAPAEWKQVMRQGWPFGVHLLFAMAYFQLDTLLLAFWKGDHAVGIYQSVMKLIALVLVLIDVASNALLPVLSRFHDEDKQKWMRLGRLLNKTLLLLSLPIALIFFVYAEQVIALIYGSEKFASAVPIMRVAAFIIVIRFALETYGLMLTTSGHQFVRMVFVIMATVMTVVLNFYAIPRYGIYGAAFVSLLTNLALATGLFWSLRSFFAQWTFDAQYILPAALTIVLGIVLWNLRVLSLWQSLPPALALYALVLYFVGYTKDERRMIFGWASGPMAQS